MNLLLLSFLALSTKYSTATSHIVACWLQDFMQPTNFLKKLVMELNIHIVGT